MSFDEAKDRSAIEELIISEGLAGILYILVKVRPIRERGGRIVGI